MDRYLLKLLVILLPAFLAGCLQGEISGDAESLEKVIPPSDFDFGTIPSNSSETPQVDFTPVDLERVDYYVRVVETDSETVVEDWTPIEPGQKIEYLSLDEHKTHHLEIKTVDRRGNSSAVAKSRSWLPGSEGCFGDMLTNAPYAGGTGTHSDPFQICTPAQLVSLESQTADYRSSFKLLANLDMEGVEFAGMGSTLSPMSGRFLGNNKTIRNWSREEASGNNIAFVNVSDTFYLQDLTFENPSVKAPSSGNVALIIGECSESIVKNVKVINSLVEGDSVVGTIFGENWMCNALNMSLTGEVKGYGSVIGGLVGGTMRGRIFNIDSRVSVTAPTAEEVGGAYGGDWDSYTAYQNMTISADVVGASIVGGFAGSNSDGSYILKSVYNGNVTGIESVGGVIGETWDVPFLVYSVEVNATLSGNHGVGGFIGTSWYWAGLYDSVLNVDIVGTGSGQDKFGGFIGYGGYYNYVYRSIANVNIDSSGGRVGGAIGYVDYWNSSYDIADSVVIADVAGSSAGNDLSLFLGENVDDPILASNSFYWSGGNCNNLGTGGCNTDIATGHATLTDFYNSGFTAYATWDFAELWVDNVTALPSVNMASVHAPSITMSDCSQVAIVGMNYGCIIGFSDDDQNEEQMIEIMEDNSCSWTHHYDRYGGQYLALAGRPVEQEIGECEAVFRVNDGTFTTADLTFTVSVVEGVSLTPSNSFSGTIWIGFQSVAGGAKSTTFTLFNNEATTVTGVDVTGLAGDFAFAGGSFPGTGGDCDGDLDPAESCTVVIDFDPSTTGRQYGDFWVEFVLDGKTYRYKQTIEGYGT